MQMKNDHSSALPLRIADHGVVFSGEPGGDSQSAAFPIPCVLPSGRWLCSFRAAPAKQASRGQKAMLTWSDDFGRTWSEPVQPFQPQTVGGRPGLMRFAPLSSLGDDRLIAAVNWVDYSDPEAPYFNEETEGLLDTRIFLSYSPDGGQTWSPPRLMDTAPFNVPTPLTGSILPLPNGELACQFELNKHYDDARPWKHASVMVFSADGGRTWPRHSIVAHDPSRRVFYWDQRPSVLPDGRIIDVFWTFDRKTASYLNIHSCESRDSGRTWSALRDVGVPGQPGPVFPLRDGTLAMPCVDRTGAPLISVRQSVDGGRSWPPEDALVLHKSSGTSQTVAKSTMQDAWSEMYAFSVGLPSSAALPGGGALVVYYAGPHTDATSIHWAVVE